MKRLLFLFLFILGTLPFLTIGDLNAQELHQEFQDSWRAKVVEVLETSLRPVGGTNITAVYQRLVIEIIEGARKGEELVIENDVMEMKTGDVFFVEYRKTVGGGEYYSVGEPDRRWVLFFFAALFVIAVLSFGFWKGIRSIISLLLSFVIIIFFLLPQLLQGAPPVPTIIFYSAIILALAMYITHGFNRVTHAAFLGTVLTITFISFLAYSGVVLGNLSGFTSHGSVYLHFSSGGMLDIAGLLLGAIIIGVLGVLDDISITQSATVREMSKAAPHLSKSEIFTRTLSIGKEHVVSLVNTLALAYAGAALPLLLLFSQSESGFMQIINMEIFSTEIIRTLVGSIGLILAVPITTLFAVFLVMKKPGEVIDPEEEAKLPHSHSH